MQSSFAVFNKTFVTAMLVVCTATLLAFADSAMAAVYVHGYTKKDGTYVAPHYRSNPDGNPYNNWSYPGNTNPYTGVTATGNPDTYLANYYNNSTGGSLGSVTNYSTTYDTNSCPLMSSYDTVSGTCKCYSGYVAKGGSCVSGYSYCSDTYGLYSTYDYTSKSCSCLYGYDFGADGTCESKDQLCHDQVGSSSQYDSLANTCKCNTGYTLNSLGKCTYSSSVNTSVVQTASVGSVDNQAEIARLQALIQVLLAQIAAMQSQTAAVAGSQATQTTGVDYYKKNHTCVGLKDDLYGDCLSYAINH